MTLKTNHKPKPNYDLERITELDEYVIELTKINEQQYRTAKDYERAERILKDTLHTMCMIMRNMDVSIRVMRILELYSKSTRR